MTNVLCSRRCVAHTGTISFVGWAQIFGALDLGQEAHFNGASLIFSRAGSEPNRGYPRWDRRRITQSCWRMLSSGEIDCERIIDPVVPFEKSHRAYEEFVDRSPHESIKLGVVFD